MYLLMWIIEGTQIQEILKHIDFIAVLFVTVWISK